MIRLGSVTGLPVVCAGKLQGRVEQAALAARVGKTEDVLIEEPDGQGAGAGYTGGYMRVHVPGAKEGTIVRVRVTGVRGDELEGEPIDEKE